MTNELSTLLGIAGTLHVDLIESDALRGNPLGDPHVRPLAVYTPPGYDPEGSERYPALYCLHGYTGNVAALIAAKPWETNVIQWADRLIQSGKMPPVLLVIVDGFTRLGGSQYVNSIHNGDYATYTTRDVVNHIDAKYRTLAHEGGRAAFGKSSGGFASLHLTMNYPGVFCAFASHSGDAYFKLAYEPSFAVVQRTLEASGGIPAFVEKFESMRKRPQAFYQTIEILGYTAAYSPRAAERFALDLPFDEQTGELRDAVFARWLAFDPVEAARERHTALARLRLRYVDCGRRDEYSLDIGARVLVARLREMGLEVQHEEFDDDHRNVGYRHEVSLPALAHVLDRK